MAIPFAEWLPDFADRDNPGATEAKNVVPTVDGYDELKQLSTSSTALDSACIGGFSAIARDGSIHNFAGSTTGLFRLISDTWTTVVGGFDLTPSDGEFWEFAKFNEEVIAVGGTAVTAQVITLGGAAFIDLPGTPPLAKHITVVRNFVVMANMSDGGTIYPSRVRWCGINDTSIWTTNKAKQADYQPLPGDYGQIQSIKGGETGIIIMEHSVWQMHYVGPPQVFTFDETLPGIGTPAPNSVIQVGQTIYMLSQDGFIGVDRGHTVIEIGRGKINKWFYDTIDTSVINRVVGSWDKRGRLLKWIFPASGNTGGRPNHCLIFDLVTGRWSHCEGEVEWILQGFGTSLTLEDLNAFGTIDTLPASLDSSQWISGGILITAFDEDHKSGGFDGSALAATIETAEKQLIENKRAIVERVRLEVDTPSSATIQSGTRDSQSDSISWGDAKSQYANGSYPMREESRYHRFRVNITGGFTRAQGITIEEAFDTGRR